ncbi:hypothetical protein ElyMa_003825300 [Elysia marginata]|uniref:Uncharacterized protein n=1 Tax=Elysia marginata TaxID=1093978 RepID=A0AAV4FHJ7_9GAST|nr:hypothetical protein ElyMa_003825300 [Elysia marginata]
MGGKSKAGMQESGSIRGPTGRMKFPLDNAKRKENCRQKLQRGCSAMQTAVCLPAQRLLKNGPFTKRRIPKGAREHRTEQQHAESSSIPYARSYPSSLAEVDATEKEIKLEKHAHTPI